MKIESCGLHSSLLHHVPSVILKSVTYLLGFAIRAACAKAPPKFMFENVAPPKRLLSERVESKHVSTRSIHTVFNLQRTRIDAAVLVLENLVKEKDAGLEHLSRQLGDQSLKEDREATASELETLKSLDQNLLKFIADKLRQSKNLSPSDAMQQAKMAFDEACTEVLNRKDWNKVETHFSFQEKTYACTQVPAAQMKLGSKDIFPAPYNGHGICCSSDREKAHATNLWTSEIRSEASGAVLFKGVRHGILSPYALEKGSEDRTEGAKNRAKEVVAAALFARPELLEKALSGDRVSLKLASTSLVTGGAVART